MPTAEQRTTDVVALPGGVMTDEVGVVTGDLTLRSEIVDGTYALKVRYRDADEWYTVTGVRTPMPGPEALDAVHAVAVALVNRPEPLL